MIRYRGQLRGSHELFQIYGLYNFSHFMIDVLNLKLRFVTAFCSDGEVRFVIRAWLHFFHSNLNLLMEFLYFTG